MKKNRVFVSHAEKDKKLADMVVDVLTACGLFAPDEIFCTSLEGLGVPSGKDFLEVIKKELQEPDLVISLISVNFLNSHFCLCELGASWVLSHELLPILVPPLSFSDLSSVIKTKQAIRLNESSDLNNMVDQITKALNKEEVNNSRWEVKRDDFIGKFNKDLSLCYEKITPVKAVTVVPSNAVQDFYKEFKDRFLKARNSEEKEDLILLILSEKSYFSSELFNISDALGIKKVVCQYHIDKLMDKDFIEHVIIKRLMGLYTTIEFRLTKLGREYLVEQGKV